MNTLLMDLLLKRNNYIHCLKRTVYGTLNVGTKDSKDKVDLYAHVWMPHSQTNSFPVENDSLTVYDKYVLNKDDTTFILDPPNSSLD